MMGLMIEVHPDTNDISLFLRKTPIIDWDDPKVRDAAYEITRSTTDDAGIAKLLFEWVRDNIPHANDAKLDAVTCWASEVLAKGTGICYAKSHLLAALLRANSIPAGFCYQVLQRTAPMTGSVLHGLNGVYLSCVGRWVLLDPRGNTGEADAQFGFDGEGLAFSIDEIQGERLYPTVYHDPAPCVVETLQRFTSREEMWPHLPAGLEG